MKRKQSENLFESIWNERISVDGKPPRNPRPELLPLRSESQYTVGRQRSTDLKGIVTELIEDVFPPLLCPVCFANFPTRAEADVHVKAKHHGEKVYECLGDCDQAYSTRGGLRYHLFNAHTVTGQPSRSRSDKEDAPKKKARVASVHEESNNESPKVSKRGRAAIANKEPVSSLPEALQKKLDQVYSVTICPSCKEEFGKKTHVIRHLVQKHRGEEPYECIASDCNRTKRYATREGLIYHLVNYHNE